MEAPVNLPTGPAAGSPSRPEPDLSVLKGPEGRFDLRYPTPADLVLVVEIASDARRLSEDRNSRARCAWNNVPCVWIVNLSASVIEVSTRPSGPADVPGYGETVVKRPGETIVVPLDGVDDLELEVAELLA